jgi:hypothetical protein
MTFTAAAGSFASILVPGFTGEQNPTDLTLVARGAECTYSIDPSEKAFPVEGGIGEVEVMTDDTCDWVVVNPGPLDWITIVSGAAGSGDGLVRFSVHTQIGPEREGFLIIAGKLFRVTQGPCTYAITPTEASVPAEEDSGSVDVTTPGRCRWEAASLDEDWLSITSATTGEGDGTVVYHFDANEGPERQGTLVIAGHSFTVTQAAGEPLTITDPGDTALPDGEIGKAYEAVTFLATGGSLPHTWRISPLTESPLPAGLQLTPEGALTGEPTGPAGEFRIRFEVIDASGLKASKDYTLKIVPAALKIKHPPSTATDLTVGRYTRYCFEAENGTPKEWNGSVRVVSGVSLYVSAVTPPAKACFEGLPEEEGEYLFTITVKDTSDRTASLTFKLIVKLPVQVPGGPDPAKKKVYAKWANRLMAQALYETPKWLPAKDQQFQDGLAFIEVTGALILMKLAEDPARDDFDQIATPESLPVPLLSVGDVLRPYVGKLRDLVETDLELYAVGTALLVSSEREQGAAAAGDAFWQQEQAALVAKYSDMLNTLRKRRLSLLEQLQALSASDPSFPFISDDWVRLGQARVRTPEFATLLRAHFKLIGLTESDADTILLWLQAFAVEPIVHPQPLFALLATETRALEELLDPRVACDVDGDQDVDLEDLALIRQSTGTQPSSGDPRDANGDGRINAADVRYCTLRLTPPGGVLTGPNIVSP